jgi:glycogen debranching enzyme
MRADELATVAGNVFVVSDPFGNIIRGEAQGLFAADTRYLSHYEARIEAADLVLLRSGPAGPARTDIFATNSGRRRLPPHALELYRRRELSDEFLESIALTNRGEVRLEFLLEIVCDTDFSDIFEVRAGPEPVSDRRLARWDGSVLTLRDRRRPRDRQTHIRFSRPPDNLRRRRAGFAVAIEPGETWRLDVRVRWMVPDPESTRPVPIPRTPHEDGPVSEWLARVPELETDDIELLTAYRQAVHDIAALEIALDSGHPIPAAGLPWYLAIFGRDSIITSLQCLLTGRRQAYGTLRTLAAYQSREDSAFRDAEPGKIAHEIRFGELAVSGAIPHARYYGTVDATPLWLILLHAADTWGSDSGVIDELLPHAESALSWIDQYGDLDGDGLIEYQRRSEHGLENQGWKDSWDGVRFAGGQPAKGPIALVEVQGYVYAARRALAAIYDRVGRHDAAERLREQAEELKRLVHEAFWMPAEGFYAIALDGQKRQVDSITSNPGHLLWCGLPEPDAAARVAERLLSREMCSGWGIRTMATDMTAYNPFSYHNGSVWPHDNSLIIAGLARYGLGDAATRLINAMLDAAACFELNRLPELFCGYARDQTPFPVDYPVACSPQAWASGSVILMLQTMAGISARGEELVAKPLPHGRELRLSGVRFKGQHFDVDGSPGAGRVARSTRTQVGVVGGSGQAV